MEAPPDKIHNVGGILYVNVQERVYTKLVTIISEVKTEIGPRMAKGIFILSILFEYFLIEMLPLYS